MLSARIIPCLLLNDDGLYKTIKFKDPFYVGDPINAIRIFNEKEVDELIFLDIRATLERREPPFALLKDIASECFMPLCYGGGIRHDEDIRKILGIGIEKVALNSAALAKPSLIESAAKNFGSQSVVVAIDVKKNIFGNYKVHSESGRINTKLDPITWAKEVESRGAGEIFLNSMDRDGVMQGYDLDLVKEISSAVRIPVMASGGAGKLEDLAEVITKGGASAAVAGSLFVFYGEHKGVLITYPRADEFDRRLFGSNDHKSNTQEHRLQP